MSGNDDEDDGDEVRRPVLPFMVMVRDRVREEAEDGLLKGRATSSVRRRKSRITRLRDVVTAPEVDRGARWWMGWKGAGAWKQGEGR